MMDKKNVALWVVQGLLAAAFLTAGVTKLFGYPSAYETMPWVRDVPEALTRTIGALELLGAIGVLLPRATGVLPWLTPVAALGLGTVMILAVAFHVSRGEAGVTPVNLVLLALAATVAWGRRDAFRKVPPGKPYP